MVQVTPANNCQDARDGATTSVELLNALNDGNGMAIGFNQDYHVQFRLVSLIAGNAGQLGGDVYGQHHEAVLKAALTKLNPQYIVGTCSFAAAYEKQAALDHQTMVLAQVGPPGFYNNNPPNPYLFGVHINSDEYPIPTVRALGFRAAAMNQNFNNPQQQREPPEDLPVPTGREGQTTLQGKEGSFWLQDNSEDGMTKDGYDNMTLNSLGEPTNATTSTNSNVELTKQAVRVIYRTKSEFFNSTCQSALQALREFGFTDLIEVAYDPDADDNEDGTANQFDEAWLRDRADEICPPQGENRQQGWNPAIFACVLTEHDILLPRWKENGCQPLSLWMTPATWGWAEANKGLVPFMQGGGQWHEAFTYSDRFFDSGRDVLAYNQEKFGYYGSYDTVVAYAIPMIYAEHIETFYRVVDDPDPITDFATEEGYELLRRAMVVLNTETIFGPVSYNDNQRNVGRGAAGTQWQPDGSNSNSFKNVLVSPFLQAEADAVIPAPCAVDCNQGQFVNETIIVTAEAILGSKCSLCPVDTFTPTPNQQTQCNVCFGESSTDGATGEASCFVQNDNLLTPGVLAFGYFAACVTWALSLFFIGWLFVNRKDPVVRISQIEFLLLICIGTLFSSSTIIALSFQAGSEEDTTAASHACQAAPFLYTFGWVLQYGSLTAKSMRLHKIMNNPQMLRIKVTVYETAAILAAILAVDMIVVTAWTIVQPLEVSFNFVFGGM